MNEFISNHYRRLFLIMPQKPNNKVRKRQKPGPDTSQAPNRTWHRGFPFSAGQVTFYFYFCWIVIMCKYNSHILMLLSKNHIVLSVSHYPKKQERLHRCWLTSVHWRVHGCTKPVSKQHLSPQRRNFIIRNPTKVWLACLQPRHGQRKCLSPNQTHLYLKTSLMSSSHFTLHQKLLK